MSEETVSRAEFDALKAELEQLRAQVAQLTAQRVAPAPADEEIPEEILQVIAAAVAAFLGERAKIKIVRRAEGDATWSTQGRASVTASHKMPHLRGW